MSDGTSLNFDIVTNRMVATYSNEFDQETVIAHLAAIEDRLVRSMLLRQLAKSHTSHDFGSLPQLDTELLNTVISLVDKQTAISTRGINSDGIRADLKALLLEHCDLYETLKRYN